MQWHKKKAIHCARCVMDGLFFTYKSRFIYFCFFNPFILDINLYKIHAIF